MNILELRQKANLTRVDERVDITDIDTDPMVIAEFVRDFGLKYFSRFGLEVDSPGDFIINSGEYYKSIEVKFIFTMGEFNIGNIDSIISIETSSNGVRRSASVLFGGYFRSGIGSATELLDDFEAEGNKAFRLKFRKK